MDLKIELASRLHQMGVKSKLLLGRWSTTGKSDGEFAIWEGREIPQAHIVANTSAGWVTKLDKS